MNAIVVTPDLRGWSFPPRANVARLLRQPRRQVFGVSSVADFSDWMRGRVSATPAEVMGRFKVSRATAYRWLATADREAA